MPAAAALSRFVATTPLGWAALLRPLAALPLAPETALRLLPAAFALATLWAVHRAASDLGGAVGGLAALAVVGFDPDSIAWAKVLKQYTAEAFLAVLAFQALTAHARTARPRELVRLALVLTLGTLFSNAQLFVAPPVLAALLGDAVVARDLRRARRIALTAVAVAAWDAAWFALAIAPHLTPQLQAYFTDGYVAGTRAAGALRDMLVPAWSAGALAAALVALLWLFAGVRDARPGLVALGLLLVELAVLSSRKLFPLAVPRVMLFAVTIVDVHLGAALGFVFADAWRARAVRPLAALGAALVAVSFVRVHDWRRDREEAQVEDLGPLIRVMEEARRPGDGILVYTRSQYVYAYYQRAAPVLVPAPTTVGFAPVFPDDHIGVIDGARARAAVETALARHERVWFVGSRFQGVDEWLVRDALATRGRITLERAAPRALLVRVER